MTSWVITIAKEFPQHWDYAQQHQLWDFTRSRRRDIRAGDQLYFWLAGTGFVGTATATSDLMEHEDGDGPWDDEGLGRYAYRVLLEPEPVGPRLTVSWSEVLDQTSTTSRLNAAPVRFGDSDDEVWLWSVFSRSTRPDLQYPEVEAELEGDDVDWERDDRKRQERAIAIRLGQRGFRARLVAAYAGRCAVTGYSALAALEAAHIAPYRGEHSHDVRNGLLLRADIHTLFDLKLLTVTPDWIIHVSQELSDSEYWSLDGKRMAVVPSHEDAPLPDLLAVHNDSFGLARS
jgi:hypothetical protein